MALLKVSAELPESADEIKTSLTSLAMSCLQQRLDTWQPGTWQPGTWQPGTWQPGTWRLDTRN